MAAQCLGHLLHRLDARPHDQGDPLVQEFPRPGGRVVVPELLELHLEQIGPNRLQVVLQYVTQANPLIAGEILPALEHAPAGLAQDGLVAVGHQFPCFRRAHVVERVIHLGHDVKSIQDIERIAGPTVPGRLTLSGESLQRVSATCSALNLYEIHALLRRKVAQSAEQHPGRSAAHELLDSGTRIS